MTIRNAAAYMDSLWDWAILDDCFGRTKIHPTDIDGFVERNGHFLVLETKRPGVRLPTGQRRTFETLRDTGLFTVFVVWGEANEPRYIKMFRPQGIGEGACNLDDLRRYVSLWFNEADK